MVQSVYVFTAAFIDFITVILYKNQETKKTPWLSPMRWSEYWPDIDVDPLLWGSSTKDLFIGFTRVKRFWPRAGQDIVVICLSFVPSQWGDIWVVDKFASLQACPQWLDWKCLMTVWPSLPTMSNSPLVPDCRYLPWCMLGLGLGLIPIFLSLLL